jgi:tetratricopeptide (TPR) repeat protein
MDALKSFAWWLADSSMLLLFALLPFFFVPLQWMTVAEGKVLLIVILLALAAIGWIVAALLDGGFRIAGIMVLIAGILLPIVYAISGYLSGLSELSLVGSGVEQDTLAAAMLWFAALALATFIFSGNSRLSVRVLRALILGGLALVVLEIAHIFFPAATTLGALVGQTGNPIGDWYQLGIAVGFFLIISLALVPTIVGEGIWRIVLALLALLSFALLVVISLRDVWIAIAAASFLFVFIDAWQGRGIAGALRRNALWIALGIVAVIFAIFYVQINSHVPSKFQITSLQVRPSLQGTLEIGHHALSEPKTLLFGSGPNSFSRDWGLYKPLSVNQTPFWNVDFSVGLGSIPTTYVTLGYVGVAAWALFALALLWMGIRALRARHEDTIVTPILAPLFLCSIYLLGFHIMYVPGAALSILMFLVIGLFIGVAASAQILPSYAISFRGRILGALPSVALAVVFAALVVAAGVGAGRVVYANALVDRSVISYSTDKDLSRSSALVADALRVYPKSDRAQRAAVELGIVQLEELASKADPNDAAARARLQAQLESTIQHGLDAVSINDADYQNWLELAFLYQQLAGAAVSGAYPNAIAAYQRAAAANPTNPLPLLRLAQLELIENNVVAALQNLAAAVKLKPDIPLAYYLASQAYASQGDLQDAVPVAKQATVYDPNDALGWYNYGALAYSGGKYAEAETALRHALAIEPQYANALYILGLDLYAEGRAQDSVSAFEQLNAQSPNQQVAQILANLRAGKPPLGTPASGSSTHK